MYKLRDYQQKASDAAVSFFNNKAKKTNAIMVLPTGSGKSLIIADIAARLDGHTLVFQPKNLTLHCIKKILVHSLFGVYKMTFIHNDVLEVGKQFGMILHTADGGKCYPAYLL